MATTRPYIDPKALASLPKRGIQLIRKKTPKNPPNVTIASIVLNRDPSLGSSAKPIQIYFPGEIVTFLKRLAATENTTLSTFLRDIIYTHIEQNYLSALVKLINDTYKAKEDG